jgi:hypothetical protein
VVGRAPVNRARGPVTRVHFQSFSASFSTSPWAQLAAVDRSYPAPAFTGLPIPADFNFAFDVVDRRAAEQREHASYPVTLLVVLPHGGPAREVSCLSCLSSSCRHFISPLLAFHFISPLLAFTLSRPSLHSTSSRTFLHSTLYLAS